MRTYSSVPVHEQEHPVLPGKALGPLDARSEARPGGPLEQACYAGIVFQICQEIDIGGETGPAELRYGQAADKYVGNAFVAEYLQHGPQGFSEISGRTGH
jgi:hypothetical protein